MKDFLVTYKVSDSIYSSNIIWANTGNCELEAATETAERHASRYGYRLVSVREITSREAYSYTLKGMPRSMIDDEAEEKYDLGYIAMRNA